MAEINLAVIGVSLDNLTQEIRHLTSKIEVQDQLLHKIELTTTTRIAEVQKDINEAFAEMREIKEVLKSHEKNDLDLANRLIGEQEVRANKITEQVDSLNTYKIEQLGKWESQTKVNDIIHAINKVLWATFLVMLSLLTAFIWEMIKSGGIANMVK